MWIIVFQCVNGPSKYLLLVNEFIILKFQPTAYQETLTNGCLMDLTNQSEFAYKLNQAVYAVYKVV